MDRRIALFLLFLFPAIAFGQGTIRSMPDASSVAAGDGFFCDQGTSPVVTRECLASQIATFVITYIDTEAEFEAVVTDVTNFINENEIDTEAELEALLGDVVDVLTDNDTISADTVEDADFGDITVSGGVWSLDINTVSTFEIQDGQVSLADMSTNSVDSDEILEDAVGASELDDLDSPVDEECLTYEATGARLEWETCGTGGGSGDITQVGDCTSDECFEGTDGTVLTIGVTDPADAGALRLENAAQIAWESAPAGTDSNLGVNASEQLVFSGSDFCLTASCMQSSSGNLDLGAWTSIHAQKIRINGGNTQVEIEQNDATPIAHFQATHFGIEDQLQLRLFEDVASGTNYIGLSAPTSLSGNSSLEWAATGECTGTNGGALTINSSDQVVCDDDDGGGGSGGAFDDTSDPVVLNTTTKNVVIGTSPVNSSKLTVDGDNDEVQVTIQGATVQSNDLFVIENVAELELFTVDSSGNVFVYGGLTTSPTPAPSFILQDSDSVADPPDDNALFRGDLTDTGDGSEDMDFWLCQQVGGSEDCPVYADADGVGNDRLQLPDSSIGPDEILSAGQTDEYCLTYEATGDTWAWQSCGAGGGGTPNILDLGDDASNESIDLVEIATSGDTNSIFTEPAADKLLIDLSNDWPKADTADDLTCTDCIGDTEISTDAGTSLAADLEEEDHASEHSDGGADEIVATNLASACADSEVLGGDGAGGLECQADQTGAGSGAFSDASDPVVLNTTTKDVVIGAGQINASKLSVDNETDQVAVSVQGHSTQTNDLLVLEQNGGTEVMAVDNDGNVTLGGTLTTAATATPGIVLKDSDSVASPEDDNARLHGNLTDTGDGSEDMDLWLAGQRGGAEVNHLYIDADGGIEIGNAGNASLTVTTDGTGSDEVVLPNDSIGADEIWSAGQADGECLIWSTGDVLSWGSCGAGSNGFATIGSAVADSGADTITVSVSSTIDFTTTDDPEDLTATIVANSIGSGFIATDGVQLVELDDDANTPTAGDFLIVETGANTVDYLTANAGTDITADLEEEAHASEHAENAADELFGENLGTACTNGQILKSDGVGGLDCAADSTGGSPSFDLITTGTNTTATMTVGSGASVAVTGTGAVTATQVPATAGAAPTTSGTVAYDSTANDLEYGDNGVNRKVANLAEAQTLSSKTVVSSAADPADTGFLRGGNNTSLLCAEASPTGTDVCLTVNASEQFTVTGGTILGSALAAASVGTSQIASGITMTDPVFSGSAQIPNGTAPVVDGAGEIAHDTSGDQLVWGAAANVVEADRCSTAIVENLAAADNNFPLGMALTFGRTIISVGCHCNGTCSTPAEISLEDRAGNAMTHTTPTCSTGTTTTTPQSVTAANSLTAGEGFYFDVDNAVSPETDTYEISFCYTVDRE